MAALTAKWHTFQSLLATLKKQDTFFLLSLQNSMKKVALDSQNEGKKAEPGSVEHEYY